MRFEYPSTLALLAALSVEMFTKCETPTAAAASSTDSVPHTLLFSASDGCDWSSGRCLSAAAWNTTSGRISSKSRATRSRSRMSASTSASESSSARPSSESCTPCRPDSSRSIITSLPRRERRELAAELRADRAAGAGDDDGAAADVVGDALEVGLDLVAAEEVGLGGLAEVADAHLAAEQLAHRRHDLHVEAGAAGLAGELTDERTVAGGHGHDQRLGAEALGERRDVRAVAEHPDAADREVALAGVVVEQRDGHVRAVGVEEHRPDRALATVAGTEDDRLLAVEGERPAALLEQLAGDVARAAHADERDDPRADDRAQRCGALTRARAGR